MAQLQVRCLPFFVKDNQPRTLASFGEKTQTLITKRINEDYNSIIEDMFNGFDIAERKFEDGILTIKITPNYLLEKRYNIKSTDLDSLFNFVCKNFPKSQDVVEVDKYEWRDLELKIFKDYELRLALTEIKL